MASKEKLRKKLEAEARRLRRRNTQLIREWSL